MILPHLLRHGSVKGYFRAIAILFIITRLTIHEYDLVTTVHRERQVTSTSMLEKADSFLPTTTPPKMQDHLPFPRWDKVTGIPLLPLLEFMDGVLHKTDSAIYVDSNRQELHRERKPSESWFSEILYVVGGDAGGVFVSQATRSRTSRGQLRYRVEPTEGIMAQAWSMLKYSYEIDPSRYARLHRAIFDQGGFPYVAWYGDYKGCDSIPLFVVTANVSCPRGFPVPTYKTILESQEKESDWDNIMQEWKTQYANKIQKVVWRGGLTGELDDTWTNPRWRLVTQANKDEESKRLFDVYFTTIPPRHDNFQINVTAKVIDEGLWAPTQISPMSAFQQYAAILDTDGNSCRSFSGFIFLWFIVLMLIIVYLRIIRQFVELSLWELVVLQFSCSQSGSRLCRLFSSETRIQSTHSMGSLCAGSI